MIFHSMGHAGSLDGAEIMEVGEIREASLRGESRELRRDMWGMPTFTAQTGGLCRRGWEGAARGTRRTYRKEARIPKTEF